MTCVISEVLLWTQVRFYSICFRKCSSIMTCRLSRNSLTEGFFSTERSPKVSEEESALLHSGVTSALTSGAVSVLASVSLSRETALLGPLPSTVSAVLTPSKQAYKYERWKTSESFWSTPKIHIYKGTNTLWKNSTLTYHAWGTTAGISMGYTQWRQRTSTVTDFHSNLTTKSYYLKITEGKDKQGVLAPW